MRLPALPSCILPYIPFTCSLLSAMSPFASVRSLSNGLIVPSPPFTYLSPFVSARLCLHVCACFVVGIACRFSASTASSIHVFLFLPFYLPLGFICLFVSLPPVGLYPAFSSFVPFSSPVCLFYCLCRSRPPRLLCPRLLYQVFFRYVHRQTQMGCKETAETCLWMLHTAALLLLAESSVSSVFQPPVGLMYLPCLL